MRTKNWDRGKKLLLPPSPFTLPPSHPKQTPLWTPKAAIGNVEIAKEGKKKKKRRGKGATVSPADSVSSGIGPMGRQTPGMMANITPNVQPSRRGAGRSMELLPQAQDTWATVVRRRGRSGKPPTTPAKQQRQQLQSGGAQRDVLNIVPARRQPGPGREASTAAATTTSWRESDRQDP